MGYGKSHRRTEHARGIAQVFNCRALRLMIFATAWRINYTELGGTKEKV